MTRLTLCSCSFQIGAGDWRFAEVSKCCATKERRKI